MSPPHSHPDFQSLHSPNPHRQPGPTGSKPACGSIKNRHSRLTPVPFPHTPLIRRRSAKAKPHRFPVLSAKNTSPPHRHKAEATWTSSIDDRHRCRTFRPTFYPLGRTYFQIRAFHAKVCAPDTCPPVDNTRHIPAPIGQIENAAGGPTSPGRGTKCGNGRHSISVPSACF